MPHSTTVQVQTEFIMWISEDLENTKSPFLFVSRFKKSSEDGRKRNQEFGAEFKRTRQLFNRKLVSTVLKVCLLSGIRYQQVFRSDVWFKRLPKIHTGEVPMATNVWLATKVPMAAKVQMATKAPVQCSDNKSSNGNQKIQNIQSECNMGLFYKHQISGKYLRKYSQSRHILNQHWENFHTIGNSND